MRKYKLVLFIENFTFVHGIRLVYAGMVTY